MIQISTEATDEFIEKWSGVTASELSTAQSFALDLCQLLGVDSPHPDAELQYMFERPVTFTHGDGSTSAGRIDLYKRGCFVLEAKKLKAPTHTKGFDDALLRARTQAEQYARAAGQRGQAAVLDRRRRRQPDRAVLGIQPVWCHLHFISGSAQLPADAC